jgi:Uma2 family endonuclease
MAARKSLVTADELLRMPDDGRRYELLDGVLVEVSPPGERHGAVTGNIYHLLRTHVDAHGPGRVLTEIGIYLGRNPDRVRAPDVCFIAGEYIPAGAAPVGFRDRVPDLIVEVVSPFDRPGEVEQKVAEWLRAGARLVWAVYPESRSVRVHRGGEPVQVLTEADTIDAEPVLPGFRAAVRDFFA